jgi:DNA (cytosine-5)-methyltransferase 1
VRQGELALSYTVASFFSGIGGLDLGLERSGFAVRFHCEINPFCRGILRQHWPDLPVHHDIRKLDDSEIPEADVWAAGFPCQDLSLARMGPRSGLRGSQSGLFHEFVRLLRGRGPRAVVLENVHGLLSSHGGRDFAIVLKALDELGYGVAWRVLNSKDFGVPQQRRRVYIVALHRGRGDPGKVLFEPECGNWNPAPGRSNGNWTLPKDENAKWARQLDSLRYHAVGNAVTPQVARWVGTRLAAVMAEHDLEAADAA